MPETRSLLPRIRTSFTVVIVAGLPFGSANAHWGHLGELAGHAHIAGVALAGLAVVLGAGLALKGKGQVDETAGDAEADTETEGEPVNG